MKIYSVFSMRNAKIIGHYQSIECTTVAIINNILQQFIDDIDFIKMSGHANDEISWHSDVAKIKEIIELIENKQYKEAINVYSYFDKYKIDEIIIQNCTTVDRINDNLLDAIFDYDKVRIFK